MSSSRLVIFIILSLIFHAAVLTAVILFSPSEPDEPARPMLVGVTTPLNDPGKGKGNFPDPAPMKEPAPEKKAQKPAEKKIVRKTVGIKTADKKLKKEIASRDDVSESETASVVSAVSSENTDASGTVSPEGTGKGTGLGYSGNGLDTRGSGRGTEIGYPDYGNNPKPEYPRIAMRHGYEGLVVLNVYVMETGNVGKVEIRKSSGYEVLDNSALDAVKKWTFIPGKKNGRAIASWVVVPIRFDLTNG